MGRWWKDVGMVMGQCIRVLLKGKQTLVLLTVGMVVLIAMLLCLDGAKEEKSRISIGMADEDNSPLSTDVISGMQQLDLYDVTVGKEKELLQALKAGELEAVCVFKEGYEAAVEAGNTGKLVTIYETEHSAALLVGDILAGVMMQEICTAKGYLTLKKYMEESDRELQQTLSEYRQYVSSVLLAEEDAFSFDVTYLSADAEVVSKPAQKLIYEQAIFAVFALMAGLLAVYTVLPFRRMCHGNLAKRVKTLPVQAGAVYVGNVLGALVLPFLFGGVFLACFFVRNKIEISTFFSLLICTLGYLCVIVCIMLVAAYGIQSQRVYQMGMLAIILIFGILGLASLVDGLLLPEGTTAWVPNGWYVRRVTELLN